MYYRGIYDLPTGARQTGSQGRCLKCDVPSNHRSGLCKEHRTVSCEKCSKKYQFCGEKLCSKCRYRQRLKLRAAG